MQMMPKMTAIVCVALELGIATVSLKAQHAELAHDVGFCDVIQRNESPCVLVNAPEGTPESKSARRYIRLEKGLSVPVRITKALHSRDIQSHVFGQRVDLEVVEDVVIEGVVVIAAGTEAWGSLTDASKAPGRFSTNGQLQIMVEGTRAITGETVPLSSSLEAGGGGIPCGDDVLAGCAVGLALLGAFIKGNDVEVRKGTNFSAQVTETITLDRHAIERTPVIRRVSDEVQHGTNAGRGLVAIYRLPDDGCRAYESTSGGPFRPKSCGKAHLAIDGGPVTALTAGRVLQFELDPGQHRLHGLKSEELFVTVSPGSVQYIRVTVSHWKRHAHLAIVSSETGDSESDALDITGPAATPSIP